MVRGILDTFKTGPATTTMKILTWTVLLLSVALIGSTTRAATILSADSEISSGIGCLVIYSGQGYRVGWTQPDTYSAVNVSAKLTSNGLPNQTGRAYLTTQIGPGTTPGQQIAYAEFTFPIPVAKVVLFQGLLLRPGSYYLSIIGDSPGWGSCWTASATNVVTAAGVVSLGGLGALAAPNAYFPATPFFSEMAIPPELSIQGIKETRPLLQIASSNNLVSISWWSTNATGFVLESVTNVLSTNWQVITQGLTTNSGRVAFTTTAIGSGRHFRLRKPAN